MEHSSSFDREIDVKKIFSDSFSVISCLIEILLNYETEILVEYLAILIMNTAFQRI